MKSSIPNWVYFIIWIIVIAFYMYYMNDVKHRPDGSIVLNSPRQQTSSGDLSVYPYLPIKELTPGVVRPGTTKEMICVTGYSAGVRNVTNSTKKQIFDSYGIAGDYGIYEIDHLISLQLGGDNARGNLWPQPYNLPDWGARKKDGLENRLHAMVCRGDITMEQAQKEISENWIEAYKKYMKDKMGVKK